MRFLKSSQFLDLKEIKKNWKADLNAAFSVSLIALPLCLGVAIASGFPAIAGVIGAIIGGLIVSGLGGSHVSITGPAAGLIVVNLAAIEKLGNGNYEIGYPYALAVFFIAGILIFILGKTKAGKFGNFFPSSVIHGMLAAIGLIIIIKQAFVAIGLKPSHHGLKEMLVEIPQALPNLNPFVFLIFCISILILIVHPLIKIPLVKKIPSPIWLLAFSIPTAYIFNFSNAHTVIFNSIPFKLGPDFLVQLPENVFEAITFPNFGKTFTYQFWVSVAGITLIASIETIICSIAVDLLDPQKRKSDLNKELVGIGTGISISGLIGGLPMISEIVRSTTNIASGGKTPWSNFFHACMLIVFLFFGKSIINLIPLSALAAMLCLVGYRLANPKEFINAFRLGINEFLVFVSTVIFVIVIDLLVGICIGIALNFILNILKSKAIVGFKSKLRINENIEEVVVTVFNSLTFSNYISFITQLQPLTEKYSLVTLDLLNVKFIDHSVIHHLHELEYFNAQKGVEIRYKNNEHLVKNTPHPFAALIAK